MKIDFNLPQNILE